MKRQVLTLRSKLFIVAVHVSSTFVLLISTISSHFLDLQITCANCGTISLFVYKISCSQDW